MSDSELRAVLTELLDAIHQGQLVPRHEASGYIADIVEAGETAIAAAPPAPAVAPPQGAVDAQ